MFSLQLLSHKQTEDLKDNRQIGPIDTIYETNSTKGKSFTQHCFPMIVNTKTTLQYVMKIYDEGINYDWNPGNVRKISEITAIGVRSLKITRKEM